MNLSAWRTVWEASVRPRTLAVFYLLIGLGGMLAWRSSVTRSTFPVQVIEGPGTALKDGFNPGILATTRTWALAPGESLKLEVDLPSGGGARGAAFGYRAEGLPLRGVTARLLQRTKVQEAAVETLLLDGNTPGFLREVIGRAGGPAAAPGERLVLELNVSAPVRSGWFEIAPVSLLNTDHVFGVARDGWLVTLWKRPVAYALLLLPALVSLGWHARRLGIAARLAGIGLLVLAAAPPFHFSRSGEWPGLMRALAAESTVGLVAGARLGWFLLPSQAVAEHIPPVALVSAEWARMLSLQPAFAGNATSTGDPARLVEIEAWLRQASERWPLTGVQALSLLLPLGVLAWAFQPWKRRTFVSVRWLLPAVIMVSGLLIWVIHPSWQLPIAAPLGHFLGHLLMLLIGFQMLLAFIGLWAGGSTGLAAQTRLTGTDHRIGFALAIAAIVIHLPQLSLSPTVESDETNGGSQASQVAELFGLSVPVLGRVVWAALIGAGVLAILAWRRARWRAPIGYALGLVISLAALGYAWGRLVTGPVFAWSEIGLFRYPPGIRLVEGVSSSMGGSSIEWSRLMCVIFAAASGAVMFSAARIMNISRWAAAGGTVVYFASQLVFYWSSFGYYVGLFLLGHAMLFLCWARWRSAQPGGQGWLMAGIWIATLLYFVHQSGIAALLTFLPMAGLAIGLQRTINWRDLIALAAGTFAVAPWIQLWQDGIVGSWFGWVGRTISWGALLAKLGDNHAWSLPGWTLLNSNGIIWMGAGLAGLVCGLMSARHRLLTFFCATMVLGHGVLQILVGRMSEYDGYGRFVVILVLPAAFLIMLVFETVAERWPATRVWLPVLILSLVAVRSSYRFERQPHVMPPDRATNTQWNGNGHGFFPERLLAEHIAGIPLSEVGVLIPWNISGSRAKGIGPHGLTSMAALQERLAQNGCRYLVTLEPKDEATFHRYFNIVYRWPPDVFDRKMIESPRTYFADWSLVADIDYWNYRILVWSPTSN
jgi:hypothetical protein